MQGPDAILSGGRTGVLLINLGTPDAPTYGAVRRYLAEFLSDRRVIEMSPLLWLPILYGPILTLRPLKSAKAYAKIWNYNLGESPLRTYTRAQADKLADALKGVAEVAWAFRYGTPTIAAGLEDLQKRGCDKIVLFALYPQYSATSTGTAYDKAFDALKKMRWQPAVRTVPAYYRVPEFISAMAAQIKGSVAELDWQPEVTLASYHSIPFSYQQAGDPYPDQCRETSVLLRAALGMNDEQFQTSFQSRVGTAKWVGPYSDVAVKKLGSDGVKKLAVVAPAFSSDCLETLEEIDMELRETFFAAGGTHFHYIPCLNAGPDSMKMIEAISRQELSGWIQG